jgi:hypothetical protein
MTLAGAVYIFAELTHAERVMSIGTVIVADALIAVVFAGIMLADIRWRFLLDTLIDVGTAPRRALAGRPRARGQSLRVPLFAFLLAPGARPSSGTSGIFFQHRGSDNCRLYPLFY